MSGQLSFILALIGGAMLLIGTSKSPLDLHTTGTGLALVIIGVIGFWKLSSSSAPHKPPAPPSDPAHKADDGFFTKVVGVTAKNPDGSDRQTAIAKYCKAGLPLILQHEPDNPYDKNAIAVRLSNNKEVQIGYLRSEIAERAVRCIRNGGTVTAQVSEVTGGTASKQSRGVNIKLTMS